VEHTLQEPQFLDGLRFVPDGARVEPTQIRGSQSLPKGLGIGQRQTGRKHVDGILVAILQDQAGSPAQAVLRLVRLCLHTGLEELARPSRCADRLGTATEQRVQPGQLQLEFGPSGHHSLQFSDRSLRLAACRVQLSQDDPQLGLVRRNPQGLPQMMLQLPDYLRRGKHLLTDQILGQPVVSLRIAGLVLGRDPPQQLAGSRQVILPLGGQSQAIPGGRRRLVQDSHPPEVHVRRSQLPRPQRRRAGGAIRPRPIGRRYAAVHPSAGPHRQANKNGG